MENLKENLCAVNARRRPSVLLLLTIMKLKIRVMNRHHYHLIHPLSWPPQPSSPASSRMQNYDHTPASSKSSATTTTTRKPAAAVCIILSFILCLSIANISDWVLLPTTAVLSGSSALRLLKLQDDDAAGAVAASGAAAAAAASTTTSTASTTPSLSLFEILSSKRRAFWQDTVLQQEIQANVDCHGKRELLSILYAAGILTSTPAGQGKTNKNKRHYDHAQQQPTPPPVNVNVTATTTREQQYQAWLMEACPLLAPWSDVTEMYGSQPVVIGMETCARYRQSLANNNHTTPFLPSTVSLLRVAGLYNTGTNSLQRNMHRNLFARFFINKKNPQAAAAAIKHSNVNLLQVPWGKHLPVKYKYQNVHPAFQQQRSNQHPIINPGLVLPIVLVRDPYRWAQTMCKRSYDAKWERVGDHCPNFVRTLDDDNEMQNNQSTFLSMPLDQQANNNRTRIRTYPVTVKYHTGRHNGLHDEYPSMADMWSTWHRDYLTFSNNNTTTTTAAVVEPRLLVRFEDLLFHAEEVFSKILECVGVTPESWVAATATRRKGHDDDHSFKYTVEKTKGQKDDVDFMGALVKYGRNNDNDGVSTRIKGMKQQDLLYAAMGRIDGDDESTTLFDSSPLPPRGLDPKLMEMFRYRHPQARIDVERKT